MLEIQNLDEGKKIFKALGSDIRIEIMKCLLKHRELNMNEMASRLHITNGALTSHIKKLEEAGLIKTSAVRGNHGSQKVCRVAVTKLMIDVQPEKEEPEKNIYDTVVRVGHFSDYDIYPTCGIATADHLIGELDDPRYFAHPDHLDAQILWFTKGYVEYIVPNLLPVAQKIDRIMLTMEISSEAPGTNDVWPSDITLMLNEVEIGQWTSPGDFGDVHGRYTPDWWFPTWNQYGLLKSVEINSKGTFMDGIQISGVSIEQFKLNYKSQIRFKFMIASNAKNIGGMTIFGRGFGNYDQDINIRINYSNEEE